MKRSKVYFLLAVILVIVMTTAACGAKSSSTYDSMEDSGTGGSSAASTAVSNSNVTYNNNQTAQDVDTADSTVSKDSTAAGDSSANGVENSSSLTSDGLQAQSKDKIIKRFNLELETKDFDHLITKLNDKINSLGGYVESSSINGQSYYNDNVTRSGNIVARIPSNKTDEFVGVVSDSANVTNNTCSTENVTLQYIDAQSRIDTLKIEQERLYAILEKAEDLDSIITLESRLSEIRYELQNYESQLRSYDNDVEYSTVTLNIQEVERITPVTVKKQTFTSRIKTGFCNTIYNISEGFKNFAVWFIVNLPYLLIWGIIIFAAVLISRKILKKSGAKRTSSVTPANSRPNGDYRQDQKINNQIAQNTSQHDKKE